MSKRKKPNSKKRSKFRASWRGQLRFGLVSFEVQAVNAENRQQAEIHFHLLHEPDHQRIHYAKICPKHGEVPNDEIVEGFEYAKGRYVEFEKEELDVLRTEQEKALAIDAFVSSDEIDPIYFDGRMYYLLPSGANAAEPYALLAAAMEKKKRWGVGQVVFSGREQLAVVRPLDGVLQALECLVERIRIVFNVLRVLVDLFLHCGAPCPGSLLRPGSVGSLRY